MSTATTGEEVEQDPQSRSWRRIGFRGIFRPVNYDFDFEKLLPSSCVLNLGDGDSETGYRINQTTLRLKTGETEQKYTGKTVVCKHWLRGLCKKGDLCEFLHEYNLKKVPECWFYSKYGECTNPECMYLHVDPDYKVKYCEAYEKGFCPKGPTCVDKHFNRAACKGYLLGFCKKGPECPLVHVKYKKIKSEDDGMFYSNGAKLPVQDDYQKYSPRMGFLFPGEPGPVGLMPIFEGNQGKTFRSLETVTCFKCGMKGHYANRCTKRRRQYTSSAIPVPIKENVS